MKRLFLLIFCGFLVSAVSVNLMAQELGEDGVELSQDEVSVSEKVFYVYHEKYSGKNNYVPSGYMGDFGDIKLNDNYRIDPHSGRSCIQIEYLAEASQGAGWMGIYWQNPPENWGDQPGGYDLTGHTKLTFWAKGDRGGEIISEFKMGGIGGEYFDSDSTGDGPFVLTDEWKQYELDLRGLDLSYISGGFCLSARLSDNPDGFIIYLDEIRYEK